jgi:hypothetical protein
MTTRWITTRGIAATVAVLALGTPLAGCGTESDPVTAPPGVTTPVPAPSTAVSAEADPEVSGDVDAVDPDEAPDDDIAGAAGFVAVVRSKLPTVANDRRDEEISLIAEAACGGLAGGLTADQLVTETRSLGTDDATATDQATARELIKLAIDKVCPEEKKRVTEF